MTVWQEVIKNGGKMEFINLWNVIEEYKQLNKENQEKANQMYYNGCSLEEIRKFCKIEFAKPYKEKIPKEYKNCTFENFETITEPQKNALEKAKNFAALIKEGKNKGKNLIITGNGHVGTGKTHLGFAIVNFLFDNGIISLFLDSIEMFNSIRKYDDWDYSLYKTFDILFIDDLGKEKVSEWTCQTLYDIINSRYKERKTTILTIEKDLTSLENYYNSCNNRGKAIISRLTSDFDKITLCGEDYRHKREL